MLEDAGVRVAVTERALADDFAGTAVTVALIDEIEAADDIPASGSAPDDLAYVIYTSGSTGKPKGVAGHPPQRRPAVRSDERLVPLRRGRRLDAVSLLRLRLLRLGVVGRAALRRPARDRSAVGQPCAGVVPGAARGGARHRAEPDAIGVPTAHPGRPRHRDGDALKLRYVIFGGEALELQSLRPWFERHGDDRPLLVNMYGITETTVHVTYRPIRLADLESGAGSVIGEPIPDSACLPSRRQWRARAASACPGEIVRRRRRRRARLPEPAGTHRPALRPRSVRRLRAACTAPATSPGASRTAISNTSAASTTR